MSAAMSLSARDFEHIWHPFRSYGSPPATGIVSASGSKVRTEDGRELIDAISSWWVNVHGHNHPVITAALKAQLDKLHHVAFADFTHEPAVVLSEKLKGILPGGLERMFFSDDGSTAVEVALKLAIQYWRNIGAKRSRIVALDGAYHGDTFGAMAAGARSVFSAPFDPFLFEVERLPFPGTHPEECVDRFESLAATGEVAAFIYEPLLQGVAGMRIFEPGVLNRLLRCASEHEIITIADEVMTGFGRTGRMFASEECESTPDLFCLSKGLTGGTLPLGVTACSARIFDGFKGSDRTKTFFHGHSYTANPLACAAAIASIGIFENEETWDAIRRITAEQESFQQTLAKHPRVEGSRSKGTVSAFEITVPVSGYLNPIRDIVMAFCRERGVYIRPHGNTVYVLPPYCITPAEMRQVQSSVLDCLDALPE